MFWFYPISRRYSNEHEQVVSAHYGQGELANRILDALQATGKYKDFIMEFHHLTQRALNIRAKYAQLEVQAYDQAWTRAELAQGFVGDVGDLMKLIMAREGLRTIPDVESKLAHELSDCLWSILVLAAHYEVDLESSFLKTMDNLEHYINTKLDAVEIETKRN